MATCGVGDSGGFGLGFATMPGAGLTSIGNAALRLGIMHQVVHS